MKHQNPTRERRTINAKTISHFGFLAAAVLTLISVFALGSLSATAQSGRRSTKPTASPTPTPTPEPTPAETTSTDKDKKAVTVIVGMESTMNAYIPQYLYDDVLQGCAMRLDQARSVKVDIDRNMTRSDALKRARAQEENPVVFLRLRSDNLGASTNAGDYSQLYIEYVVFEAQTTKVLSAGNVYQGGINKGVVTVPTSRGGAAAAEFRLKQAAKDAADRILNALHLTPPHMPLF